jgi:hypothetical protein
MHPLRAVTARPSTFSLVDAIAFQKRLVAELTKQQERERPIFDLLTLAQVASAVSPTPAPLRFQWVSLVE